MAVEHRKNYEEKKFNFFYKITNDFDDCYYYGIHSTNNMNDGYMGSGKRLRRAQKKHGIEHFIRTVLVFFDTRLEAAQYEFEFLTPEILSDPNCYNICEGGGGGDVTSGMSDEEYEEFCKKVSENLKGRKASNETLAKKSKITKQNWKNKDIRLKRLKGLKKASNNPKVRAKRSSIQKERYNGENGDINRKKTSNAVKKHFDEHPEALKQRSKTMKKKFEGKNGKIEREKKSIERKKYLNEHPETLKALRNASKGKTPVNNGILCKRIPNEELDEFLKNNPDWVRGMIKKDELIEKIKQYYIDNPEKRDEISQRMKSLGDKHPSKRKDVLEKISKSNKGQIPVNNGIECIKVHIDLLDEYLATHPGWVRGMIKRKKSA